MKRNKGNISGIDWVIGAAVLAFLLYIVFSGAMPFNSVLFFIISAIVLIFLLFMDAIFFTYVVFVVLDVFAYLVIFSDSPVFAGFRDFFSKTFNTGTVGGMLNFILSVLAIFFLTVTAYSAVRLLEIRRREHEHLQHEMEEYKKRKKLEAVQKDQMKERAKNPKWVRVLSYLNQSNPSDWKLAVIEADSILDDLLKDLGFTGESLGDRLKTADQESFPYLTQAWEVHGIRNRVAHESDFPLSVREAKRVAGVYETIFRYFDYI